MSKEQPGATTRRAFLGTATVATAASLTGPMAAADQSTDRPDPARTIKLAEANVDVPEQLAARAKAGDWTKPAAMAIPKEGYFKPEQGRYGPIFPKTPANYGFTIIAKIKPGREEVIRAYGKNNRGRYRWRSVRSRPAQASLPEMGPLQHRRRHVFHVPRDIRYRLRQIYRRRSRSLQTNRGRYGLRKS